MDKPNLRNPQSSQQIQQILKYQQTLNKQQYIKAILANPTQIPSIPSPAPPIPSSQYLQQQLEPFRQYLYTNKLFSNTRGSTHTSENKLLEIIKQVNPNFKCEPIIMKLLKDFSKVYLQEVMEKYVEIDENRRRCKKGWTEGEGQGEGGHGVEGLDLGQVGLKQDIFQSAFWEINRKLWAYKQL